MLVVSFQSWLMKIPEINEARSEKKNLITVLFRQQLLHEFN